ncbi:sterile alpha motif domain-containing protein 9-like [Ptychodera flava]|uniref:sterile alpha motif domain-containing protein 9-like n=1 Tax=Ptychodera flava TaxID=63121 RepID=UPI00396A5D72
MPVVMLNYRLSELKTNDKQGAAVAFGDKAKDAELTMTKTEKKQREGDQSIEKFTSSLNIQDLGVNRTGENIVQNQELKLKPIEVEHEVKKTHCEDSPTFLSRKCQRRELSLRLQNLLCGGSKKIDASFYPILVINKPEEYICQSDGHEMQKSLVHYFEFIGSVKWVGVFDFDAESYESGLCNIYQQKNDIKAQLPDTFHNIRDVVRFRDGLKFPEITTWIFSNGRSDMAEEEIILNRKEWNAERSRGVEDAISFFAKPEVVPDLNRAVILFLILSDDIDIMSDTFRKFYSSFGIEHIVCIAEKNENFTKWADEIEKWCPKDKLEDRSVVGMPWEDVKECIMKIQGVVQQSDFFLPTSTGARCPLSERDKNRWSDLSIVCQNECENTDMNKDNPNFEDFIQSMEVDFYRGQKVSWWNFHLNDKHYNHVLKRDIHQQLNEIVQNAVRGVNDISPRVVQVRLFHQPGAGGSTVARHIIWDFHKTYRCTVVNRITPNTGEQILEFRKYSEADTSNCLTTLVLVEDAEDIEVNELVQCLSTGLKGSHPVENPYIVLLHCRRVHSTHIHVKKYAEKSIGLDQQLSTSETKWFADKYIELDSKNVQGLQEYNPDRLVSFMVMKDNFKKDYVENLVSGVIEAISQHRGELKALQYCALMNKFEPDSAIPVACLDGVMGVKYLLKMGTKMKSEATKGKQNSNEPWEFNLSDAAQMLMLKVHIAQLGGVFGIKVVHPIVADEVLKQCSDKFEQTTGNTTMNYIKSDIFKSHSHSKEYLLSKTHDMLIRRKKVEFGDEQDSEFSDLIENIRESEGTAMASDVLKCGFQIFEDALIGQQLARLLYIKEKNFAAAHKYASEAIALVPTNSYLLDTRGQIFKHQIKHKYEEKYCANQEILPIDKTHELLQLAFQGIDFFRRSQEANLVEKSSENNYGFFGEVDVTFLLLQILESMEEFRGSRGQELMHSYLITDKKPKELSQWAEYHRQFKALRDRVEYAIDWISDYVTYYKVGSRKTVVKKEGTKLDKMKHRLEIFHQQFAKYFGESRNVPDMMYEDGNVESINDWRRRQVIYEGGNTFHKIFDMTKIDYDENFKKLIMIRKLLMENNPPNAFDLQILVCVNLAISSFRRKNVSLPSLKEVIDMAKSLLHQARENKLYALYFLTMFLWPRDSLKELADYEGFTEHADALRVRWESMQKKSKDAPQQSYSYKKVLRQQPVKKRPLTYFFLAQNKGLGAFVHINKLNTSAGKVDHERDQFWESPMVVEKLVRIEGMLKNNVSAIARVTEGDKTRSITVRLAEPKDDIISQEPVTFYLGFSWSGPTAFDVKPKERRYTRKYSPYEESITKPISPRNPHDRITEIQSTPFDYDNYRKQHRKLERKLGEIDELKKKQRQGVKLEPGQIEKIKLREKILKDLHHLEDGYKRRMYAEYDI